MSTASSGSPAEELAAARAVIARLREVVAAKDELIAEMETRHRAEVAAEREARRSLEVRVAELERRMSRDSSNSSAPPSKDPPAAKAKRKKATSQRQRSKDRKPGGHPGHAGSGLAPARDPNRTEEGRPAGTVPQLRPVTRF